MNVAHYIGIGLAWTALFWTVMAWRHEPDPFANQLAAVLWSLTSGAFIVAAVVGFTT